MGAAINLNGFVYDSEGNLIGRYAPNEVKVLIRTSQKAHDYAYKSVATIVVAGGNDYINVNGNGSKVL